MQRLRIVGGMDRDSGKAGVSGRARDADGDLAAVGDQQLVERHDVPLAPAFTPNQRKIAVDSDFLVAEHETLPGILCKWNFVPRNGNR
jgi:hypothetical protein